MTRRPHYSQQPENDGREEFEMRQRSSHRRSDFIFCNFLLLLCWSPDDDWSHHPNGRCWKSSSGCCLRWQNLVNMSQYVMVRIPLNMGLFEKDQKHTFSMGLRHQFTGLLKKEDNPNMEPLLSKLEESKTVKQDNFRI